MPKHPLHVISGGLTGDAALDTAVSRAILVRVSAGDLPATLQVGMPHKVVAFGKHDTLAPGFRRALDIAQAQGFDATVRIAGGRAVVFHPGTVRFAWTVPESAPAETMHARFDRLAQAVVDTLNGFDIPAEVGELPGEYCAGRYSVHLLGGAKVMGVGQRLARHGAQVGGMIVVDDPETINAVLQPIYDQLAIPLDPAMTGALSDTSDVNPEAVGAGLARHLSDGFGTANASVDEATYALAVSLRRHHDPQHLQERPERR
jgi:lipoate-protein ligase A